MKKSMIYLVGLILIAVGSVGLLLDFWPSIILTICGFAILFMRFIDIVEKSGVCKTIEGQVIKLEENYREKETELIKAYSKKESELKEAYSRIESNFKKALNIAGQIDKITEQKTEIEEQLIIIQKDIDSHQNQLQQVLIEKNEVEAANNSIKMQVEQNQERIAELKEEIEQLSIESLKRQYDFSIYEQFTSEECKNQLTILKNKEQEAIRNREAVKIVNEFLSKREMLDNVKQIIRCFNSECDNILLNLTGLNVDYMRSQIERSYNSLNKIFAVDGIQLTPVLLEIKLEQLNLIYTYEIKKEQEKEQQRAIKEQMLEEEKVRRELERRKAKVEKDCAQYTNEIKRLMAYMRKSASEAEKTLYINKINELENKLKALEAEKESILERETNARAGYVYVISNIGSFGENVFKIGMTRRLEPMERIDELSSASVPFNFDVHAMIFSNNAPELENELHRRFANKSVNRVNNRKEFFRVSIDEIEEVIKEQYDNTIKFKKIPVAEQYRKTLEIIKSEAV